MKRALLIMTMAFVGWAANQAQASNYTFEGLTAGQLNGQDNWKWTTQAGNATDNLVTTPSGTGNTSAFVVQNTDNAASLFSRINDANFSIPSFVAVGGRIARFQLDGRLGTLGGAIIDFGVGHDANANGVISTTEAGWRYGMDLLGATPVFESPTGSTVPFTSAPTSISKTDWIRVRLDVDFTASKYTESYMDLTTGETSFSAIPGMQNVPFTIGALPVSQWDAMLIDVRNNGQLDNLTVDLIPEPSTLLLLGVGCLVVWRRARRLEAR